MRVAQHHTTDLDLRVECAFLTIKLVVVVRVHLQIVESEFLLYSLLEGHTFLQRQGIGFGYDGHDVDHIRELLQHDNVDRFKPVLDQPPCGVVQLVNCERLDVRMP